MPANRIPEVARYVLCAAVLLLAAAAHAATPVSFRTPRVYPAAGATQVAAADFNGDGYADLAVVDYSNAVAILLNNGHGTFRPAVTYAAGTGVTGLAVGDFNADGIPDLAVTDNNNCGTYQCAGSVSILLGNGDGTFRPPLTFTAGIGPSAVAAGDFNGDGKLDIVIVNYGYAGGGDTISVLLGNGDGTFQPEVDFTVGYGPDSVAVADFNGDGKLDLAVALSVGGAALLLGNGDGTFRTSTGIGVPYDPNSIVAGDLNGDGKQDLVVAGTYSANKDTVSVLLGNGDGTFQPAVGYPAQKNAFALVLGDFNGDGQPDVAVANATGPRGYSATPGVTILLGKGDGTLEPAGFYGSGGTDEGIAVADFDKDGRLDLAVGIGDAVAVMRGDGHGHFQRADSYAAGVSPDSVAVSDFDGDGKLDMAVANSSSQNVSFLRGNGDGTFQPPVNYAAADNPGSIVAGDFNGDGKPDLVMTNYYLDAVSIMLGNGDGTFQPPVTYPVASDADFLIVGDFNGDQNPDIAAFEKNLDNSGTISILLGKGDGTFLPVSSFALGSTIASLAAGDFNGDGKLDLAACYSSTVSILLGNGDGTFQLPIDTPVNGYCYNLAVADFNGDGKPDLVVTNTNFESGIPSVSVMLGKGNGTFWPAHDYVLALGDQILALAVADFNGDGELDVVVNDAVGASVAFLLGKGNGGFEQPSYFAAGTSYFDFMAVGDFNGDGKPDLAMGDNSVSGGITVLTNTSP